MVANYDLKNNVLSETVKRSGAFVTLQLFLVRGANETMVVHVGGDVDAGGKRVYKMTGTCSTSSINNGTIFGNIPLQPQEKANKDKKQQL